MFFCCAFSNHLVYVVAAASAVAELPCVIRYDTVYLTFQSHYREGSPMSKEEKLRWEGFVEKIGFEPR